ncbi:phosphodiesterase [Microbacterium dextranolyticum]|uniref:3',5'-cyclic adenosine monophosphate phosphodiesterase CpdA n=1 Tax=Microbacterium dextranolyticum TaxID=36806 RepID=A0A9W6M507_9MICO|nr:phosphodiesterase [Microbacterium dextranolyticum]MBM7461900.1 3',5'-cyclic AMP phosphodiesterase CpdA [Microbacterium dextranolyticum]GLJ94140.1 3',5'-cyclic adenosine monophosphate phosphodiesterase CpdA [Microbacterium dextranolyticum]
MIPAGQHGPAEHFILHLSDTHFVATGDLLHDRVDSDRNLIALFEGFEKSSARPEAIVFTGDLADTGRPDAYERLRAIVEPAAERLGAQVIWVMGNHDERVAFRRGLLDEDADAAEPVDRVFDINGLRIIALDSTVPGHHHGEITETQLEWLAHQLEVPAPHGTLLALHHPPVPSPLGLLALVELRDQDRLAAVVEGTDVRGILGGHLHYSTHSTFAGIPVSVASATCYTQDLQVVYPGARGQDGGQSYNLVHVYGDRVLHSIVPLGQFPTVYEMTPESLQRFMAMSADEQIAAVGASVLDTAEA